MDRATILDVGPGVVVRAYQGGGDVLNAWEVLADASASDEQAQRLLEARCEREEGVDFYDVLKAIQWAINDRRRLADRDLRGAHEALADPALRREVLEADGF